MAQTLTPQGIATLEGVPTIMDSHEVFIDSILSKAAANEATFINNLGVAGVPSEFEFGATPIFKTTLFVQGFSD